MAKNDKDAQEVNPERNTNVGKLKIYGLIKSAQKYKNEQYKCCKHAQKNK